MRSPTPATAGSRAQSCPAPRRRLGILGQRELRWLAGEIDAFPSSSTSKERGRISRLEPTTAILSARWDAPQRLGFVEAVAELRDDAQRLSAEDGRELQRIPPGGLPGFTVHHLRAGARIGEHLRIRGGIENVEDRDYRLLGSGVNEAGRSFVLELDAAFSPCRGDAAR